MSQTQTPTEKKPTTFDRFMEHVDKAIVIAWFVAAEAFRLDSTLAVVGGLVIFVTLVAYSISRKKYESSTAIELEKVKVDLAKHEVWTREAMKPRPEADRQFGEMTGKLHVYHTLIRMCEESSKDQNRSEQECEFYASMARRLKDMSAAILP